MSLPGHVEERSSISCFKAAYCRSCPQRSKGFLSFFTLEIASWDAGGECGVYLKLCK